MASRSMAADTAWRNALRRQERLMGHDLFWGTRRQGRQIEEQEAVFQTVAGVHELEAAALAVLLHDGEIARSDAADDVALAGFEEHGLVVLGTREQERKLIQVR